MGSTFSSHFYHKDPTTTTTATFITENSEHDTEITTGYQWQHPLPAPHTNQYYQTYDTPKVMGAIKRNRRMGFYFLKRSASQGFSKGQLYLAHCYQMGQGTNTDLHKAIRIYYQASKKGTSVVKCHLANAVFKVEQNLYRLSIKVHGFPRFSIIPGD
ncbi:hypothetical protein G9A89_014242 [Geosiphon pyriformis]|nr:hypothetical protein G9A89_014242 [Geosiphon pyriformis]